jgi:hypothetical protein
MADEDERGFDAASAADSSWSELAVPDDISGLAADIAAYHRELRRQRRRDRWQRLADRRGLVPLLVVTGAVTLAAVVATLLTVMAPKSLDRAPGALPLARPSVPAGQVGGLLPKVTLSAADGSTVDSQSLRPGVLTLVPPGCACSGLLNALSGQAFSESIRLAVIVPASSDADAAALDAQIDRGSTHVYYDPRGTLAAALGIAEPTGHAVTALIVNRNGEIYDKPVSITNASMSAVSAQLQSMLAPSD